MYKVVVIDDENVVRNGIVLETDWAALGCMVVGEAADGVEGLEQIEKFKPDIVICDIRMPKMDGIEMLKKLREKGDDTYVIFLTAYSDFYYAQQAIRYRATDYLLKPYGEGDLEEVIKKIDASLRDKESVGGRAHEEDVLSFGSISKGEKSKYVSDALDYIADNLSNPDMNIKAVSEELGISESHLSHIFKKETEYTVGAYITRYRIRTAMKLLRNNRYKVYEVAEMVGYRDIAYFSNTFKKLAGVNPSEYQERLRRDEELT